MTARAVGEVGPDPRRPRVFGIGLNKTATTSLHEALTLLGYESLHWGGPPVRRRVEAALAAGRPLLSGLDPRYDAFSDIEALSENFALLDRQYPGSRFVLTVRDVDGWVASRRRHVEENRRRKAAGEYHGTFLDVDEPAWREHWHRHVDAARAYFAGRADFVEVDLTADPGWEPLCTLLGRTPPAVAFPWANRGRAGADGRA